MRWVALEGNVRLVVGGIVALGWVHSKCLWHGGAMTIMGRCSGVSLFGIGWTLLIKGTPPGVLFQVNLRWSRGVIFRTLFTVWFHACIVGGASVIHGMVRMGVSSIIFCSSSLTLCSACGILANAGRSRISSIFDWSSLMSHRPFLVALAMLLIWPTCWWVLKSVGAGSCLSFNSVGGTVLWNPRFDLPESWECSVGHIGSDPLMGPGTIRWHRTMLTILCCHHLCRQLLCIPTEQGDIGSDHSVCWVLHKQRLLGILLRLVSYSVCLELAAWFCPTIAMGICYQLWRVWQWRHPWRFV